MQTQPAKSLSIVIPVGPSEERWRDTVLCLASFPGIHEIILSVTESFTGDPKEVDERIQLVSGSSGRAAQLNRAAKQATGKYLWFVHADSQISLDSFQKLHSTICNKGNCLVYCDLVFQDDGPAFVLLNQYGAWVRSRFFGIPFGDQGFCIASSLFHSIGGFNEQAAIGEDHLFVWQAKRAQIPIISCGGTLQTSARKYSENGWFRTTLLHLWVTCSQIWQELRRPLTSVS